MPPRPPKSGRPALIGVVVGIVIVLLAAVGIGGFLLLRPQSFTLSGSLVLSDGFGSSTNCFGTGGLRDIAGGTQVTVTDSAGSTVALGQLELGDNRNGACVFEFRIPNVPGGKGFYGVEVAHRGVVRYPEDTLKSGSLQLGLG